MTDISWLKVTYFMSVLTTVGASLGMIYSVVNGNVANLLLLTPVLTLTYPIALIGTAAYLLKKTLQRKSIFELMNLAGGSSGLSGMMDGLQTEEGEENEE